MSTFVGGLSRRGLALVRQNTAAFTIPLIHINGNMGSTRTSQENERNSGKQDCTALALLVLSIRASTSITSVTNIQKQMRCYAHVRRNSSIWNVGLASCSPSIQEQLSKSSLSSRHKARSNVSVRSLATVATAATATAAAVGTGANDQVKYLYSDATVCCLLLPPNLHANHSLAATILQ